MTIKNINIFFSFFNEKSCLDQTIAIGLPDYFSTFKLSDETIINIRLLDINGAEKFRTINESCYKKADCCLLVYDITNRKSFIECQNYYRETIKEKCKKKYSNYFNRK